MGSKKQLKLIATENRIVDVRGWSWGRWENTVHRVQTAGYKGSSGNGMHNRMATVYSVLYT